MGRPLLCEVCSDHLAYTAVLHLSTHIVTISYPRITDTDHMLPCNYINLLNFMPSPPNYAEDFLKAKATLDYFDALTIFSTGDVLMMLFNNNIKGLEE